MTLKQSLPLSVLYFSLTFLFGLLVDSVRVPYIQPLLGARWAEILEMPLMLFIIWNAAQITTWNLDATQPNSKPSRAQWWFATTMTPLAIGVLASIWLVAVEAVALAMSSSKWSWEALTDGGGEGRVTSSSLEGAALVAFAVMPWLVWMVNGLLQEDNDKLLWDLDEVKDTEEDYCRL